MTLSMVSRLVGADQRNYVLFNFLVGLMTKQPSNVTGKTPLPISIPLLIKSS